MAKVIDPEKHLTFYICILTFEFIFLIWLLQLILL
jgi:hypothetical protein